MTNRRSQQGLLAVTAVVYASALLLPAVTVSVPFTQISFAGWEATFVALGLGINPDGYTIDGLSRLLFVASATSNLLFVAAFVVAARAVVTDASRRPQRLSATWERALVAALLLNAYWLLHAQLIAYYLWLLAFALLALLMHWCRRRIAGNTVGLEAKGAAPHVQPAA